MKARTGVVIGSAILGLVGLMSSPAAVVRKRSATREGNHPANVCAMPSIGRPAGFAFQFEGARLDVGWEQVSAALVDPVADGKRAAASILKGYRWDLSEGPTRHPW